MKKRIFESLIETATIFEVHEGLYHVVYCYKHDGSWISSEVVEDLEHYLKTTLKNFVEVLE